MRVSKQRNIGKTLPKRRKRLSLLKMEILIYML